MSFRYLKHWLRCTSIQSIFVLILMSISHLSTAFAQTSPKGGIDWILVVDTSASMRGVGGTKNIFEQVKNSITEFVNTARLGDTITLYNFDQYVTLRAKEILITNNQDRTKLKKIISALKADGIRTHTGLALQEALQISALLNQRTDAVGRTVSIVFLTDGLEDVQGIYNPVSIPQSNQLLRQQQCKTYVFFVSLGLKEHEKQLNDFASNPALCGKGQVLRDPGGVHLNQLAQNIQPILVNSKLDVTKSSLVKLNVNWSLLTLMLLVIALITICLIQRKTPLELLEDIRTRKNLEGALLILEPLPNSLEDEEVSLTHLHKSKVRLSDLIPEIAATNSDAELVIVWRIGKKNINLRCLKGVIFLNTKKVTTDELYDEDIIEIGNIKVQFNWIEHQRQDKSINEF